LATAQRVANEAPDVVNVRNHFVHLALGHREQVFAWLTSFLREKPVTFWYETHAWARFSPVWDGLRDESRLEALLRETMPADARPFDAAQGRPSEAPASSTPTASAEVVPPKSIAEKSEFQALTIINATRLAEQRANPRRREATGEPAPIPARTSSSR